MREPGGGPLSPFQSVSFFFSFPSELRQEGARGRHRKNADMIWGGGGPEERLLVVHAATMALQPCRFRRIHMIHYYP